MSTAARDIDDLISRSITGLAQIELAHLCSSMTLHPSVSRFPSYEKIPTWGFQQINYFFLYFAVVLRMYVCGFILAHCCCYRA